MTIVKKRPSSFQAVGPAESWRIQKNLFGLFKIKIENLEFSQNPLGTLEARLGRRKANIQNFVFRFGIIIRTYSLLFRNGRLLYGWVGCYFRNIVCYLERFRTHSGRTSYSSPAWFLSRPSSFSRVG